MDKMALLCAIFTLALATVVKGQTDAFEFNWPGNTDQCGTYDLTWNGGSPPFTAFFVPIEGTPMVYRIPDSAYTGTSGRYPILHQFAENTPYVVYMSDASGDGTGGSSIIQVTEPGSSSCQLSSSSNHTEQTFAFRASGAVTQCSSDFHLDWDYSEDRAPYNVSIVPLDQSFRSFIVRMGSRADGSSNWVVNLQAGIKFTIMFNDATGYGTGGTGGIYQVALDSSEPSNCGLILAAAQNALPAGLTTDSLPAAPSTSDRETASVTGTGRPTDTGAASTGSSSSGLSGGAIAGIVIGVLVGLFLVLVLLFCLYRRRKNRDSERLPDHVYETKPGGIDMHEAQTPEFGNSNRNSMAGIPASISRNLTHGHGHSRNTSSTPQLANFGGYEQAEVPRDAQPTVVPFTSPRSASMSPTTSDEGNHQNSLNRRSKLAMSMSSQPTFRVSNDYPEGETSTHQDAGAVNRRSTMDLASLDIPEDDATTHYRRLTDGGRFVGSPEDVGRTVDLPPLYNDIPRDEGGVERR